MVYRKSLNLDEISLLKFEKIQHSIFFRDGKRKIDAVLVYEDDKPSENRDRFIESLKEQSLELENEISAYKTSRIYIKVHAPQNILHKNAKIHGIPTKCHQNTILPEPEVNYNCMKTLLNDPEPDPHDPIAQRAWETISKEQPTNFTNCERNLIVFTMMQYTQFGPQPFMVGISQLLLRGDFIAAYPLHDGNWEWPEDDTEPLNDRQLLAKYWANFKVWHKQQPLNTIEQYFGPEIAMYFSWLGFYNKMLIIAAIMGVITYIYGIINVNYLVAKPIEQVCKSELMICPYCNRCKPTVLKSYCWYFKVAYLNDNIASVLFACAMSFWATLFMEFWKRKQNTLYLRWNTNDTIDDVFRPEFQTNIKYVRKHPYTGEMEIYVPLHIRLINYSVSVTVVVFMVLIVLITIIAIIIYECALKMYRVEKAYITITSAFMTLAVMVALRKIYGLVAMTITNAENPRTELEFDKSYMLKMVVFSLVNNYGKLIYIAFFKGKFFTYPGDERIRSNPFPLAAEVCDPTGCVSEVFILLAIITIFNPLVSNCLEILSPIVKVWINELKERIKISNVNLHSWEQDFDLNASNHFRIMEEMEEMVMQYGFITLLVGAFPLAPLLALINNVFEIRIDSEKLVKYFRRSEAVKATSITVWFDTLQAVTYLAIITNALFITFTSNFIPEMVYYVHYRKNLAGFYAFQLSKYQVVDNYWHNTNITECYYSGYRYPPEDKNAYQYSFLHYYILSCRLGFALIFIITVLGLTAIMAYAIPDIPSSIKDLIAYNDRKVRRNSVI